MTALAVAGLGAFGVYLVYTSVVFGWTGVGTGDASRRARRPSARARIERWMVQAGLTDVSTGEFVGASCVLGAAGAVVGYAFFGSAVAAAATGLFSACSPAATYRVRRRQALEIARDAWPTIIEEIRVLTGGAGRSIPTALFDVGRRAPTELRSAFDAAEREWLMSTDFERTVAVLEERLADPTADAVAETLLVAHEIGGSDLNRRLTELAEDRRLDVLARKDARSKQAGVRFARRFVILVPAGMAVAGLSLGDGRAAYQQPWGQALVTIGLMLVALCWLWSGQMLKLPSEQRAFER